jgi:hypothetical protein
MPRVASAPIGLTRPRQIAVRLILETTRPEASRSPLTLIEDRECHSGSLGEPLGLLSHLVTSWRPDLILGQGPARPAEAGIRGSPRSPALPRRSGQKRPVGCFGPRAFRGSPSVTAVGLI